MGSLKDGNGEIKPHDWNQATDFAHAETQPFDSQPSLSQFSGDDICEGDADDCLFSKCILHNGLAEYATETQVLNLAEETQMLDLGGETQILNGTDCIENMAMRTQLLDELDSDGEATDRTEVLYDSDELLDDEHDRRDCSQSTGGGNVQCTSICEHDRRGSTEQSDALTDERRSSGFHVSVATSAGKAMEEPKSGSGRRFASVRAASMRACGLKARFLASPETFRNSSPNETFKGLSNGISGRVGCLTVKRLFYDTSVVENNGLSYNIANTSAIEGLHPICDAPLGGLSYVDSREPGELSQANALNFVERLINDNCPGLDKQADYGKSTGEKSKSMSSAKGPQNLVKKANERSMSREAWIFNWDDNCEDEGGGEIFRRRKEEFYFSGQSKCYTHPQKPNGHRLGEFRGKDEQRYGLEKLMIHSDPHLLLHKLDEKSKIVQEAEMNIRKNLVNKFDQQSKIDSSKEQFEVTSIENEMLELSNVGQDTQMAAEAMEALCNDEGIADLNADGIHHCSKSSLQQKPRRGPFSRKLTSRKGVYKSSVDLVTRQSKKTKEIGPILCKESSVSFGKHAKNVERESSTRLLIPKKRRTKSSFEECHTAYGSKNRGKMARSKSIEKRKADVVSEICQLQESNTPVAAGTSVGCGLINGGHSQHEVCVSIPIAHRTRRSIALNLNVAESKPADSRDVINDAVAAPTFEENRTGICPKKRSYQKFSVHINESDCFGAHSKPCAQLEDECRSNTGLRKSRRKIRSTYIHAKMIKETAERNLEGKVLEQSSNRKGSMIGALHCDSTDMSRKSISTNTDGVKAMKFTDRNDAISPTVQRVEAVVSLDKSAKDKFNPSGSVCTTPINSVTPTKTTSPICMGEEYFKQSCMRDRLKSALMKEVRRLSSSELEPISPLKDVRKRRDLANVRVLFSHHLGDDIIKQQRKILARLGISEVSSITDATHFITDEFVRTRNTLEAIASGKPIVTHLWLESVGQVNIHIDEESYILRDIKKEREFSFCMPVTLACAKKHPLLQSRRVFITPNTKPGKEIISSLVKAVHGQEVERIGRLVLKDDKFLNDLLVVSCEEDFAICVPFLEKGITVYSSELILNGIVTQRLEFDRYQLFADHVKRTRSTLWLRKDDKFIPVKKHI